jgi:DNA-binding PadR family transcriptional regulator
MSSLRPVEFHVLLALATGPLHGYGLVRRIADESDGRWQVLPGNLYTVIRRLVSEGLVQQSDRRLTEGDDPRRRYFELTADGKARLSREARHLGRLVDRVRAIEAGPSRRS